MGKTIQKNSAATKKVAIRATFRILKSVHGGGIWTVFRRKQ